MSQEKFPFNLEDIVGWVVRKKDGVVVRYTLTKPESLTKASNKPLVQVHGPSSTSSSFFGGKTHYSQWCDHTPDVLGKPVFESDGIGLFIADAYGARKKFADFDVAIDGGNVLSVNGEYDLPYLYGDPLLTRKMSPFIAKGAVTAPDKTRILKIRWADRCPPPVTPAFWPALTNELKRLAKEKGERLNVLTICQGGHGRSGSALASIMMCLSDYTPLDALTHVRALHCARAIESKDQHLYLNEVGKVLGREPDALDAEEVTSFKQRFITLERFDPTYQDRVRAGSGAKVEVREGSFI